MDRNVIVLPFAALCRDNARHGLMNGRILLTREYREALQASSLLARGQWKAPTLTGDVQVQCVFYFPDKRRRDIGNYVKMIADALGQSVYEDDSQIKVLLLRRGPIDKESPRVEITVSAM